MIDCYGRTTPALMTSKGNMLCRFCNANIEKGENCLLIAYNRGPTGRAFLHVLCAQQLSTQISLLCTGGVVPRKILFTKDYKAKHDFAMKDAFDSYLIVEVGVDGIEIKKNVVGSWKGKATYGLLDLENGPCGYKRLDPGT